tara:strand:+ start:1793 stop:2449 length:657 start_codon:yes stop_codon:yes gene_type:complete
MDEFYYCKKKNKNYIYIGGEIEIINIQRLQTLFKTNQYFKINYNIYTLLKDNVKDIIILKDKDLECSDEKKLDYVLHNYKIRDLVNLSNENYMINYFLDYCHINTILPESYEINNLIFYCDDYIKPSNPEDQGQIYWTGIELSFDDNNLEAEYSLIVEVSFYYDYDIGWKYGTCYLNKETIKSQSYIDAPKDFTCEYINIIDKNIKKYLTSFYSKFKF